MLFGSFAFQVLGSLVGVHWPRAACRTQDVDIPGFLRIAMPPDAPGELYDVSVDPGERTNRYHEQPDIVRELEDALERFKASGRSR